MKYLDHDKPIVVGKKYVHGSLMARIVLECTSVLPMGVVFKRECGNELFYHNNDHGFWGGLKEYVPPPVKQTLSIIIFKSPGVKELACVPSYHDIPYLLSQGWKALKTIEVEVDVPQTGS